MVLSAIKFEYSDLLSVSESSDKILCFLPLALNNSFYYIDTDNYARIYSLRKAVS